MQEVASASEKAVTARKIAILRMDFFVANLIFTDPSNNS
jgi:hypothetical protein